MHFISPVFDLYSDYLLVNQGQSTATGLSALVDGKLSHDAITRSLHHRTMVHANYGRWSDLLSSKLPIQTLY